MEWMCSRTFLLVLTVFQWTSNSSLLLVTVGGINRSYTEAQLIEIIPLDAKACSGSTVTLICNYDTPTITEPKNVKVKWFFNERFPISESEGMKSGRYQQEKKYTSSVLIINEVTVNDSGSYRCEVTQDIPTLVTVYSNKSNLIVLDYSTTSSDEDIQTETVTATPATVCATPGPESQTGWPVWLVWTASALGCAVLVIAIVVFWSIFRRKQEAPIYMNTTARAQRDHSPRQRKPEEKGKMCKQTDTLKSHNYTRPPRGGQLNF